MSSAKLVTGKNSEKYNKKFTVEISLEGHSDEDIIDLIQEIRSMHYGLFLEDIADIIERK